MNGVKYYRIKKGLKQKELCRKADITLFTLVRMEHADRNSVGKLLAEHYRRARIALDVPVDELLREDLPEVEEGTHVRNMRPSGSECPENCLAVYRQAHHLTLRELAAMGTRAAILGKALYTGRLDLRTVIQEVGAC